MADEENVPGEKMSGIFDISDKADALIAKVQDILSAVDKSKIEALFNAIQVTDKKVILDITIIFPKH